MNRVAAPSGKPDCPMCHHHANTRFVQVPSGYDPRMKHCVCDHCKIGWYQCPGQKVERIAGTYETAKLAYVPLAQK